MAEHTDPLQITPDPDTLHTFHRQQLSAMLDGELAPDEAKFMLRRLEHDLVLARCWERWQVCGEVLRGRADEWLPGDFATRVAAAIQAPLPRVPTPAATRRPRRRMAAWTGAGLAASLALVAVVLVIRPALDEEVPAASAVVAESQTAAPLASDRLETVAALSPPEMDRPAVTALASTAVAAMAERPRAVQELLTPVTPVAAAPMLSRPWPRAGSGAGPFSVGYGPSPPRLDPFQPRWTPPAPGVWPDVGGPRVPVAGENRGMTRQP